MVAESAAPLNVTVAPAPCVIDPEMLYVLVPLLGVPVNATPVTFAPLTVTASLGGLNV
jgi:hypothetical protein